MHGKKKDFSFEPEFAGKDTRFDFIPGFWANIKIGYLLDQIRMHGEKEEVKDEIVYLSKKHGIITPYTSWLVMEDRDLRRNRDLMERVTSAAPASKAAMSARTGEGGFVASTSLNRQRRMSQNVEMEAAIRAEEDAVLDQAVKQNVLRISNKTFYKVGNQWVDNDYEENKQKVENIDFLSDRFFQLINDHPELSRFFAQGRNIQVVHGDRAYNIR
jgi:Ca-activated chloride channel family protein